MAPSRTRKEGQIWAAKVGAKLWAYEDKRQTQVLHKGPECPTGSGGNWYAELQRPAPAPILHDARGQHGSCDNREVQDRTE